MKGEKFVADVVCVGAHPDDVEIGMGATVAGMVRDGLSVVIVDLTDGEPTPAGSRETRLAEAEHAARVLGVAGRRTLDLPNRSLSDTPEARAALAEVLRELRPQVVFGPYPQDAHPDHIAAASIVQAARFWGKLHKTEMRGEPHYTARLYRYMAVHMRLFVEPSFVMDVSDTIGVKMQALSAYESQFHANEANRGVLGSVEQAATMWGSLIGASAGEPFYGDELVGLTSLRQLL